MYITFKDIYNYVVVFVAFLMQGSVDAFHTFLFSILTLNASVNFDRRTVNKSFIIFSIIGLF